MPGAKPCLGAMGGVSPPAGVFNQEGSWLAEGRGLSWRVMQHLAIGREGGRTRAWRGPSERKKLDFPKETSHLDGAGAGGWDKSSCHSE